MRCGRAKACPKSTIVIPGRLAKANPESMVPHECMEKWIPGLVLRTIPE